MLKTACKPGRPRPETNSWHQDLALAICRSMPTCPHGCAKDGALNCQANVSGYRGVQCEPGRLMENEAREFAARIDAKWPPADRG